MGRLFTSFDEAWESFLVRTEPLEWFYGQFPDDEEFVAEGWVVEPPPEIKRAALNLQGLFAGFDWIAPMPEHFLHVWVGGGPALSTKIQELRSNGSFDAVYRRINCFHTAVVIEVECASLLELVADTDVDPATYLPHMTIGVVAEEHGPEELRNALLPVRDIELGVSDVSELRRIRFPAARTTLLRPWSVIETVPL